MRPNPGEPSDHRLSTAIQMIYFNLLLLSLLIIASRLATVLHEVMGHAMSAWVYGGKVYSIQVSLFGGGYTRANLANDGLYARLLFSWSGILINLITGTLGLLLLKKRMFKNKSLAMFISLFSMVSILGAVSYITLGLFYNSGDPISWTKTPSQWFLYGWIPCLTVSPWLSFSLVKQYLVLQEKSFPSGNHLEQLKICMLTLGITTIVYGLLFIVTNQSLAFVQAPYEAYNRKQMQMMEEKKEALYRRLSQTMPEKSEEEINRIVDNTEIELEQSEVKIKYYILPLLLGAYTAGALMSIFRSKKVIFEEMKMKPANIFIPAVCALLILLFLSYQNEYLIFP